MLTVLLVEDDIDLAQTVVQYLELEQIQCDHASNGVAGLNLMQRNHYQVLLLDLNLPRLDGIGVCQQLRQQGDDTPILMLTARDQLDDKVEGFKAGTDDYLVKPFAMQELIARIFALSRRRSGQANQLQCGPLSVNFGEKQAYREGQLLKLSPTAWKLLETLMRASPNVVSREVLEQALWGDDVPDSNSLKVHMHNLRKSVDAPFGYGMIQTIAGQGFALREST
ncbi:MAG: response regulator transcription factor [Pseudomonadales bacterium]|nr:response regulator transcription factor [Pseudomonadales bacterium]